MNDSIVLGYRGRADGSSPLDSPKAQRCAMCGRYTRHYSWREVRDFLDLRFPAALDLRASYNVAPTQHAPIVRIGPHGREMVMARWGLVPPWAKDTSIGSRLINARAETAAEKPSFRSAFAQRRCVVPVSGFYEWQKRDGGSKQPHYIHRADGQPILLAGLWERWDKGAEPMETFTILTTVPNARMEELHDRMPAVLEPEEVAGWLNPDTEQVKVEGFLGPAPGGVLEAYPVGTLVNSPKNDTPSLIVRQD